MPDDAVASLNEVSPTSSRYFELISEPRFHYEYIDDIEFAEVDIDDASNISDITNWLITHDFSGSRATLFNFSHPSNLSERAFAFSLGPISKEPSDILVSYEGGNHSLLDYWNSNCSQPKTFVPKRHNESVSIKPKNFQYRLSRVINTSGSQTWHHRNLNAGNVVIQRVFNLDEKSSFAGVIIPPELEKHLDWINVRPRTLMFTGKVFKLKKITNGNQSNESVLFAPEDNDFIRNSFYPKQLEVFLHFEFFDLKSQELVSKLQQVQLSEDTCAENLAKYKYSVHSALELNDEFIIPLKGLKNFGKKNQKAIKILVVSSEVNKQEAKYSILARRTKSGSVIQRVSTQHFLSELGVRYELPSFQSNNFDWTSEVKKIDLGPGLYQESEEFREKTNKCLENVTNSSGFLQFDPFSEVPMLSECNISIPIRIFDPLNLSVIPSTEITTKSDFISNKPLIIAGDKPKKKKRCLGTKDDDRCAPTRIAAFNGVETIFYGKPFIEFIWEPNFKVLKGDFIVLNGENIGHATPVNHEIAYRYSGSGLFEKSSAHLTSLNDDVLSFEVPKNGLLQDVKFKLHGSTGHISLTSISIRRSEKISLQDLSTKTVTLKQPSTFAISLDRSQYEEKCSWISDLQKNVGISITDVFQMPGRLNQIRALHLRKQNARKILEQEVEWALFYFDKSMLEPVSVPFKDAGDWIKLQSTVKNEYGSLQTMIGSAPASANCLVLGYRKNKNKQYRFQRMGNDVSDIILVKRDVKINLNDLFMSNLGLLSDGWPVEFKQDDANPFLGVLRSGSLTTKECQNQHCFIFGRLFRQLPDNLQILQSGKPLNSLDKQSERRETEKHQVLGFSSNYLLIYCIVLLLACVIGAFMAVQSWRLAFFSSVTKLIDNHKSHLIHNRLTIGGVALGSVATLLYFQAAISSLDLSMVLISLALISFLKIFGRRLRFQYLSNFNICLLFLTFASLAYITGNSGLSSICIGFLYLFFLIQKVINKVVMINRP